MRAKNVPVLQAEAQSVSADDVKRWCNVFFGTEDVYEYRDEMTKSDIEEAILWRQQKISDRDGLLAEGYTEKEMDVFYQDAQRTCESLFSYEPFRSMKSKFNIVAVASPSTDSGVSVPRENLWKETAVHSHFDTFYSDRYLTTSRVKSIHNALAGIPYEHIIILANTDVYGGGGIYNSYTLTTAHHPMFKPVVVHEFGHSFGGLADEYFYDNDVMTDTYPLDVEPWEQNISTRVNFASKWKDMLPSGAPIPTPIAEKKKYPVGVYEGGGYSAKGIYRPAYDCRMKTNEYPEFCPVCQRAIRRMIEFYVP